MSITKISSFNAIVASNAKILILGSMPSVTSLTHNQYYAHPRNCFWTIIETLFSTKKNLSYENRMKLLISNKIAVWDVLKSCSRKGSLDSAIKADSIQVNNFKNFYSINSHIEYVYFNGAKSQVEYDKQVLPQLKQQYSQIKYCRLPSTSPAMATLSVDEKLKYWSILKQN